MIQCICGSLKVVGDRIVIRFGLVCCLAIRFSQSGPWTNEQDLAKEPQDLNIAWKQQTLKGVNPAASVKVGCLAPLSHRTVFDAIMIELR